METRDTAHPSGTRLPMRWAPIQVSALTVGAVFLLIGMLGFIPGVTTHLDQLTVAGHQSGTAVFGVFDVSVLHNLPHLGFGVAGLVVARRFRWARGYLIVGGVFYVVLWSHGLLIDSGSDLNVVPVNTADDWLHLALGVGMLGLGSALFGRHSDTAAVGQISAPAGIGGPE